MSNHHRKSRKRIHLLHLFCRLLRTERSHRKTKESFFHVRLQLPNHRRPKWFSLWINPDKTLTNDLKKKKESTGNTRLIPMPSSYSPTVPFFVVTVDSERYALRQCSPPSHVMLVRNKEKHGLWNKTIKMSVARESAVACVFRRKIYVMGGCAADESSNWAEVFDLKTQTWEPLPDPGDEIRFYSIKKIEVIQGKIYVRSNGKNDKVYSPKKGKWDVAAKLSKCVIRKVSYCVGRESCVWYDKKRKEWRKVRDLDVLNKKPRCGMIEAAKYRGKLLVLWDKFVYPAREDIWCAMISLGKH